MVGSGDIEARKIYLIECERNGASRRHVSGTALAAGFLGRCLAPKTGG